MGIQTESNTPRARVPSHPIPSSPHREEQEQKNSSEVNSEPSSPALLSFPTIGVNGRTWPLTEQQVSEWQACYPSLDVLAEARKALAWTQANPGRRKTSKGMLKFLVSWLNRATDTPRVSAGRTGFKPLVFR